MPRPRHEQPTPAELEILKILWERGGPSSVREVLEIVNRDARRAARVYVGHELAQRHDRQGYPPARALWASFPLRTGLAARTNASLTAG